MLSRSITLILGIFISLSVYSQGEGMVFIKGGEYIPLYGTDSGKVKITDFYMDVYPVTNEEFITFLKKEPKWRKSKVVGLFADKRYLSQFEDDLHLKQGVNKDAPVTYVSWYVAKNYCQYQGKRLPTIDEWEYVAMADATVKDARKKENYTQFILSWYENQKTDNQSVGSTFKNAWGVYDMFGLVWQWTNDFNSIIISNGSNRSGTVKNNLYCSGAAIGSTDVSNYAAFMRYAFRSSLKANYSLRSLGFRCVKSK